MNHKDKTATLSRSVKTALLQRFLIPLLLLATFTNLVTGCKSSEAQIAQPKPTVTQEMAEISQTTGNASSFQKGITFVSWQKDEYSSSSAEKSLTELASTGANWVTIIVTVYQKTAGDTQIMATDLTPSNDSLIHIISKAHELGLKVLLKPHIDIQSGQWRGEISFSTEDEWKAWFDSYRSIINHYADLARQTQTEAFCVGTELVKTSERSTDWEIIIADVRSHFSGKLTYASNFDEVNNVKWWGSVDYIGVDAYYPLPTPSDNLTVADLKAAWDKQGYITSLKQLSEEYDRPILFTEIGYRPVVGANKAPWEWQDSPQIDLTLQANLYEAALDVFTKQDWFAGMFFWDWLTNPNQGGANDPDYTPHGKPAEDVLRKFYNP